MMPAAPDSLTVTENVSLPAAPPFSRRERCGVLMTLALHAGLLVYSGSIHTPGWDEVGHLPAGIAHWQTGGFDLYRVNPPLVRLWVTALPYAAGARLDFEGAATSSPPWRRAEFTTGSAWMRADSGSFMHQLRWARWCAIPISLWAGWLCFAAARRLYGGASGFVALILWCTSPMVLGHGSLITPDVAAAATGAFALWCLADWFGQPSQKRTLITGGALGLALLSKFTNLWLAGLLAALTLYRLVQPGADQRRTRWGGQATAIGAIALYLIALGYGFERFGKPLGQYQFVSETFAGPEKDRTEVYGNRFAGSVWGSIPVPLPENYLLGIDVQKRDFEKQMLSFLRGEWKPGGWWYYYLCAFVIKEPLGTLALLLGGLVNLRFLSHAQRGMTCLWVILSAVIVIGFVSSQTGFNHHLRYALPAYPFLYVFGSSVVAQRPGRSRWWTRAATVLVIVAAVESFSVYPHSMVFFNQSIGGPDQGWRHLNHSNVDWGQNALLLADWAKTHPEARPLQVIFSGGFDPKHLPIWTGDVIHRDFSETEVELLKAGELRDRWVAISVNKLIDPDTERDRYGYFRKHQPDAKVAHTYYIYNLKDKPPNENTQP